MIINVTLSRSDLRLFCMEYEFDEIKLDSFIMNSELMAMASYISFIDSDGAVKELKCRGPMYRALYRSIHD